MDLQALLHQVHDDQTFLHFARALMADKTACPAGGADWQNHRVEAFLESAIAWAEDSDFGISQGLQASNPWQQFAVFLYCGKIYE
ncbi:hypothetical protein SJI00_04475 [Pseudomonas sp. RP23018S]|uniref:DUF7660 family protein n=1 Tax=Pseudomonas sp. RP23018S TaxID=3096037 RepID=UPI002ACA4BAA|nr:hypothetical protein [Pseudomonas sp. RP23018S]MDZ5602036.1 hypothetical protein [Pseudomonas sp. RP23018S]